MTSKHTPGPWTIGNDGYNANTLYAGDIGVCQMYGVPMNTRINEVPERYAVGMANARLISAAPDMYEALKEAQKAIAHCLSEGGLLEPERGDTDWWRDIIKAQQRIAAALSKAGEGE